VNKPIYILNGPNLNRLGKREPEIYGETTLAEIEAQCRSEAQEQALEFRQTSSEPQLIDWIHEAIDHGSGIVINPAAYSFTSIAILDALKMFPGPIVEVHITNIHRREAYYHHLSPGGLPEPHGNARCIEIAAARGARNASSSSSCASSVSRGRARRPGQGRAARYPSPEPTGSHVADDRRNYTVSAC
jgi:3-dehydroquinate dehydratase-2